MTRLPLNILSINLFMWKGIGHEDSTKKWTHDTTHEDLITKITNIIHDNDIDIIFFQEDIEYWSNYYKNRLEGLGYQRLGYCKAEGYQSPRLLYYKQLINSIWIKKDKLYSEPEVINGRTDKNCVGFTNSAGEKSLSPRCFVSAKVNIRGIDLVLTCTHLCGGKFADLNMNESLHERTLEVFKILKHIKKQFGEIPSLFAADFNSIHPDEYISETHKPPYLIPAEYDPNNVITYMTSGHRELEVYGLRAVIPLAATTPYGTKVDYVYYDPSKLDFVSSEVVPTLDVTDHNGVIARFTTPDHHAIYKDNYLYNKTMAALKANINLVRQYVPGFIEDEEKYDIDELSKKIYDKMHKNIMKVNVKKILSTIFDKKLIQKGTVFYSGFQMFPIGDMKKYLAKDDTNMYHFNENYAIEMLYQDHLKLSKGEPNQFGDAFKWFTPSRNKGALYTTACYDENDDINNLRMTVSTKYFSQFASNFKAIGIFQTNDDCEIYDLHPINFRQRMMFKRIITNILFNGKFNYGMPANVLEQAYKDGIPPLFVAYPFTCQQILNRTPTPTCLQPPPVDKNCVQGYWDGDNTLHEHIVNHFLYVYNRDKDISNKILGYIARDNGYDPVLKSTINVREIVWFDNEITLQPIGLYFKNHQILSIFDMYNALLYVLKNFTDNIVNNIPLRIDNNKLLKMSKTLCSMGESYKRNFNMMNFSFENLSRISLPEFTRELGNRKTFRNPHFVPIFKNSEIAQRGGKREYYKKKYIKYKKKYLKLQKIDF